MDYPAEPLDDRRERREEQLPVRAVREYLGPSVAARRDMVDGAGVLDA